MEKDGFAAGGFLLKLREMRFSAKAKRLFVEGVRSCGIRLE